MFVCVCVCVCVCVSRSDGGVSDGHGCGGRNTGISDTPTDHPIHGNNGTITANIPPLTDQSLSVQAEHEKHSGSYRLLFLPHCPPKQYALGVYEQHLNFQLSDRAVCFQIVCHPGTVRVLQLMYIYGNHFVYRFRQ